LSKIKVTEVDKVIVGIFDAVVTPTPTPKPIPTICFDPFNIPTKDLKDISWWMLADQLEFFDSNLNIRVAIGNIIDTGLVQKYELPDLKQTVEDMRKQSYSSDEYINFKILVAPNKSDDGKPCSYYVLATLLSSPLDLESSKEEVVKIVTESDLPADIKKQRRLRLDKLQEIKESRVSKEQALKRIRPTKVEGQEEAEIKLIEETLKNLESLYAKGQISKELFQANVKELKSKLEKGGQI
jgi:hypothetical protein